MIKVPGVLDGSLSR